MKFLYKTVLGILLCTGILLAFEIDPFNPNASLTENFSTNCLQMTQSQQMLKAYVMVGLNSNFQNPQRNLEKAIVDYDKRAHQVRAYFQLRLTASDKEVQKTHQTGHPSRLHPATPVA